ncbi:regulatory protein zeste-like [Helicoverpa armigera]|uniref:regulatory protein zeste-like n=1 Tax=Helicoverpa armigera TaxID=29058 RepID=UPI003082BBA9
MIKVMEPKKQIYTQKEKKVFLEILKSYSKVVESKHGHSSALKAKNLAWQKIAAEFNANPHTELHRTPQQLRRLWLNIKHRQRGELAKKQHHIPIGSVGELSRNNVLQIAHALITGIDSSADSDLVLEKLTDNDPLQSVQSESSLFLSEDSQNTSEQEASALRTVKMEPMSPISGAYNADAISTPIVNQNPPDVPNNVQKENHLDQDNNALHRSMELEQLEIELLREKVKGERQESKSREAHNAAMHDLEIQILKEKLREAKAKADLAELNLKRQKYRDD